MLNDLQIGPTGAGDGQLFYGTHKPYAIAKNPAQAGDGGQSAEEPHSLPAAVKPSAPAEGGVPAVCSAPLRASTPPTLSPQGADGGHVQIDAHRSDAAVKPSPKGAARAPAPSSDPSSSSARAKQSRHEPGQVGGGHCTCEAHVSIATPDLRFTDPLVTELVELHRMRRRWLKARNSLILQSKAFGRSLFDGDKKKGTAAFERVMSGKTRPGDEPLAAALVPFVRSIEGFDVELKAIEKELAKMAKRLPVAPWVADVRGLGWGSLAAIVGEAGDLSKYPSVAGVWKRLGLAVIDGDGRQRRRADPELAVMHGYSPERRSVVWNMAEAVAKLQRTWIDKETGEVKKTADPYGAILEAEKAKALAKELTPMHAENRAKRHMSKAILRDLTVEWRRVSGHGVEANHVRCAADPDFTSLEGK